jgi:hypothetical protein
LRARLESFIQAQSWFLYEKANQASGHTQLELTAYIERYQDPAKGGGLDLAVIRFLSLADAFGQDVVRDVARQMQLSESRFDAETVSRWVREGRINKRHGKLFGNLTPADQPIQDKTLMGNPPPDEPVEAIQDNGPPRPDDMRSTPQGVSSSPSPEGDRRS